MHSSRPTITPSHTSSGGTLPPPAQLPKPHALPLPPAGSTGKPEQFVAPKSVIPPPPPFPPTTGSKLPQPDGKVQMNTGGQQVIFKKDDSNKKLD